MALPREMLLQILGKYRDRPLSWHLEDSCLLHLDVFRYLHHYESAERRDAFKNGVLASHWRECGGCLRNIRATAQNSTDPRKKEAYHSLYVCAIRAFLHSTGQRFDLVDDETGAWMTIPPPPDVERWITVIDMFAPRDLSQSGLHILRARSQEVFDDPSAILRCLDQSACLEIQRSQERPEWNVLQWWALNPVLKNTALLYWNGQAKVLCEDMSFAARYRRLGAKYLRDQETGRDAAGIYVLSLRDLALSYDGRSPFSGYARVILKNREIDRYRHEQVDGLNRAETGEDPDETPAERPANLAGQPWSDKGPAKATELRIGISQLKRRLSGRQLAIVVRLEGNPDMTDEELGMKLGVRRETVTRDRAKIQDKAAKLNLKGP